ncbi:MULTISPECIES: TetR/AcrR family transcriptional regulator C-terminal domain-containing protein [Thermomonosporaceae]|uniref:TetR/AcrR family transcriptional regulator C-terminal domain-containing protein n=1 Tax=Thermomonosporaceae TaxID=2012 RepID=UPI00255A857C|nr:MULTISPECIES: TetR/AcrR family transcriptional regulator C-terminal domain-containing protein [Thermomonosporaceae]MDL4773711.1 TetR/AcrR family transcriptional regulator C-terminal domain-containing protein [Actinomadura xylanilytica]
MRLDRPVVVATALALLDEVGLDGLSLRRLAAELGVQAPALYRHFSGKDDLLRAMADAMFDGEMAVLDRPAPGADWADWLVARSRAVRRAMLSRRDGGRLREHMHAPADQWPGLELLLQMMEEAGFEVVEAMSAIFALGGHILGSVIAEQEARRPAAPDGEGVRIDPRRFPRLARAAALRTEGRDFDREFEYGLAVFIAGLRRSPGERA